MDLDREDPGSIFVGDGMTDPPVLSNKPRPEVQLPPEPWWARYGRIAAVAFFALWVVACVVMFIVR